MAAITIRGLSDETHRGLKALARREGRSTEAQVRAILDAAVSPIERVALGSLLVALAHDAGVTADDAPELDIARTLDRDRASREPVDFT